MLSNKLSVNTGTPLLAINSKQQGALIESTGNVSALSDASDKFSSRFWYDELGRLCLSQNAKQFNIGKYLNPVDQTKRAYSYTLYDDIGRIKEVGELITSETTALPLSGKYENQVRYAGVETLVNNPINTTRQITRTYYDVPAFPITWQGQTINQDNLRTRVASVTYQENPGTNYDNATHFSYDAHGNAKTLIQEIANKTLVKRLDYDYDLVSGNVHFLYYQKDKSDQFIHRYEYDGDNRVTEVYTSRDGIVWDNDANYDYYAHGPIARMTIGENKVEAQNYAYTIQGWTKGLDGQHFKYALGYNNNDYTSVGTSILLPAQVATGKDLYNGHIATWASKNSQANGQLANTWTQQFIYDQLNRIKSGMTLDGGDSYKNTYSYDANGNILELNRFDAAQNQFDQLKYNYHNTASGENYKENTNKLAWIDETYNNGIATSRTDDIEDMGSDNYKYDETGNLVFDASEGIERIEWNTSGKITKVIRKKGGQNYDLAFSYDATGHRVSKTTISRDVNGVETSSSTTYYVRNSQGKNLVNYLGINASEFIVYGSGRLGSLNNGSKVYELTDHLGNVRTVLNERGLVFSATDYYPFGMALGNKFGTYRYGFHGKELDNEGLGGGLSTYDYGFRIYNTGIARFLSVDPLVSTYPMLTPYQFASNRPIDGIDLDGKEYLREDEARVKIVGGSIELNLQNCSDIYRAEWNYRDRTQTPPAGNIGGFPKTIGTLEHPTLPTFPEASHLDGSLGANDPTINTTDQTVNPPTSNSSRKALSKMYKLQANGGAANRTYKQRTVSGASPKASGVALSALVLNAVSWGIERSWKLDIKEDVTKINEQVAIIRAKVLTDLQKAIDQNIIPEKYMNVENLGQIANVILTGENLSSDKGIGEIGMKIVKEISKNYRAKLDFHFNSSGSSTTPADALKTAPVVIKK